MFDSPSLSPCLSTPSSCLSKMCHQRASVRALLIFLVEELAVRHQGPRLNSLPALVHCVEAPSSLVVVLLLAARSAVLFYACPSAAPSFGRTWPSLPHWSVCPVLRSRAGCLPSRCAGSSWVAGPPWLVAPVHFRSERDRILCRRLRPRSCDHVSSVERVLQGRVQHRGRAPRGSTRRLSI